MRQKKSLEVIGTTPEGLEVVTGVYRFVETHGVPLDVLLGNLKERNKVPYWPSFYQEARDAGMKHERILSKLDESLSDVYGPTVRDSVIQGLEREYGSK